MYIIPPALSVPVERSDCARFCPATWEPVCGSDYRNPTTPTYDTYANQCTMDAKSCLRNLTITKVNDGECSTNLLIHGPKTRRACAVICPQNWAPICGTDGKTYSNYCSLRVQSCKQNGEVFKAHDGECGDFVTS